MRYATRIVSPAKTLCLAVFVVMVTAGLACRNSEPRNAEPAPPEQAPIEEEERDPVDLSTCPRGYEPWLESLERAQKTKGLPSLEQQLTAISARCSDQWEAHWALGDAIFRRFDFAAARPHLERAAEIAEAESSEMGLAWSRYRLGFVDFTAGKWSRSESMTRFAIEVFRRRGMMKEETFAWNNLAAVLQESGRFGQALEAMDKTEAGLERLGLAGPARRFAQNKALLQISLGDAHGPEETLSALYEEAKQAGDGVLRDSSALALASLHRLIDAFDTADAWYARVGSDDTLPEAATLSALGRGRVALLRNDPDAALMHLDQAATIAEKNDLEALVEVIDAFAGAALLRVGRSAEGTARLRRLMDSDADARPELAWLTRWLMGREFERRGDERSLPLLKEALSRLETEGLKLDRSAEGMRFLRERIEVYIDLAAAYARREGYENEIADIMFRAHARSLAKISAHEANSKAGAPATIQASMPEDALIISYLFGREQGVALAITRDVRRTFAIPGRDTLSKPVKAYRAALIRPLKSSEARAHPLEDFLRSVEWGMKVSDALLAPVADLLDRSSQIFIVPDGELALLPFAALIRTPVEGSKWPSFLGATHDVAVLPVLSTPAIESAGRYPMLLVGDAIADEGGEFPALDRSAAEVAGIFEQWEGGGEVDKVVSEEVTVSKLGDGRLARYRTIHFATHAVASTRDPRKCAVICSRGERFGFDRIAALHLDRALVVLSSCRGGEGEIIPGEGIVGLGWAFLSAGASATVTSLWQVEDDSAARLMLEFHRRLRLGSSATRALAAAGRLLARERAHPAYWAPFVIALNTEARTEGS